MSQSLLISVVIPCRGHAEVLSDCLHAALQQETPAPYEVIVVDSAADPAVARVAERFAGVRLLRHEGGLLAGEARNLGVEAACGEYLAFTDADCTPERGWLRAALDALQGDARLVGGPIGDALPLHPVAVSDNLLQFADFAVGRPDGEARNIPACNMAVSRLDFVELGGFVHQRGMVAEDTALCTKALEYWPDGVRFVQAMRVRHRGRTQIREFMHHHYGFGVARGAQRIHLSPMQVRLARLAILIPLTALWRLRYIFDRVLRWRTRAIVPLFLLLPLIAPGLVAWSIGLWRGLRAADGRVV